MKNLARFFLMFSLVFSALFSLVVQPSFALTLPDSTRGIMPVENSYMGQNHSYSVFFRGNGEAVVGLKVNYTNYDSAPIYMVKYAMPKGLEPQNIFVYQITQNNGTNPCYQPTYDLSSTPTPALKMYPTTESSPSTTSEKSAADALSIMPPCYPEPYWYGNLYKKADYQMEGDTLTILLPDPIWQSSSVNFFVSFRTFGYAQRSVDGLFTYEFETLKSGSAVDSAQIGISTEEGYVLKDADAKTNYYQTGRGMSMPALQESSAAYGVQSQEMDSYVNSLGQGSLYKNAANLAPNESYTVKGVYADKIWKLYLKEAATGLLSLVVILIAMYFIGKFALHWLHAHSQSASEKGGTLAKLSRDQRSFLFSVGLSFISSLFIAGHTLVLFFITSSGIFFGYYSELQTIISLLLLIISFSVYIFFLLSPAIYMTIKRGIGWGIFTFALTVMWLIFYVVILFIFAFIFRSNSYNILPMPPVIG